MSIIKYLHYGKNMSVREDLKGLHSKHCLCYENCKSFKPNTPGKIDSTENCPIAQGLYEFDVKNNVTTPVWECEMYEKS